MNQRVLGFDIARTYAIFGMYIVNFNTVFGDLTNHSGFSGFLNLFNGNSSTLFVMLAGMGVSLMCNRAATVEDKLNMRNRILKRSWFLFVIGLVLFLWWPADILHFYGGYMHFAALCLFVPKRFYLWAAAAAILVFHLLLVVIPYDTGWDFNTFRYLDFWTINGFIRNTFYNGWNPIFPWIAYFFLGMYLGKLDWNNPRLPRITLFIGIIGYLNVLLLQTQIGHLTDNPDLQFYVKADYLPPVLPFMWSTASFGLIIISLSVILGRNIDGTSLSKWLASTGQMTLTHYVSHLTGGILALSWITGIPYQFGVMDRQPSEPWLILLFAILYFLLCVLFSVLWKRRFTQGPLEMLMRRISG